jgi:hypothetical protein
VSLSLPDRSTGYLLERQSVAWGRPEFCCGFGLGLPQVIDFTLQSSLFFQRFNGPFVVLLICRDHLQVVQFSECYQGDRSTRDNIAQEFLPKESAVAP